MGELALIDSRPRSASIIAVKDCELSFINRTHFEECVLHPEISRYLLNVLAARLREADEALVAGSFLTVKARVARILLDLAKHLGENAASGRIMMVCSGAWFANSLPPPCISNLRQLSQ